MAKVCHRKMSYYKKSSRIIDSVKTGTGYLLIAIVIIAIIGAMLAFYYFGLLWAYQWIKGDTPTFWQFVLIALVISSLLTGAKQASSS